MEEKIHFILIFGKTDEKHWFDVLHLLNIKMVADGLADYDDQSG